VNWLDIVKMAVGAGIVTTLLGQCIEWLREAGADKRKTSRIARYSAVRIAVVLEQFAIHCAELISNRKLYYSTGGAAGKVDTKIPALLPYPDDVGWNALEISWVARALMLRNEIMMAQQEIDFWYDLDWEAMPDTVDMQSGKCGYLAWRLAADLREYYRLPLYHPGETSWDAIGLLEPYYRDALAGKKKAQSG